MRHLILLLVLAASLVAQEPKKGIDIETAKQEAARFLVNWQERYTLDPGVGRFGTQKELDRWREGELKRLEKLRKKSKANQEWPYEGVYRVRDGRDTPIPPGYRVGGTSIVCWALMEEPGYAKDKDRQQAVRRGFKFILDSFKKEPLLASGFKGAMTCAGGRTPTVFWRCSRAWRRACPRTPRSSAGRRPPGGWSRRSRRRRSLKRGAGTMRAAGEGGEGAHLAAS